MWIPDGTQSGFSNNTLRWASPRSYSDSFRMILRLIGRVDPSIRNEHQRVRRVSGFRFNASITETGIIIIPDCTTMSTNQYEYADLSRFRKQDFEVICRNIVSRNYNVRVAQTKASRDGGKDLVFTDSKGVLHYVECKTEGKPIGEGRIKEFNDTCNQDGARGIYISLSGFTSVAVKAADVRGIDLLDFGDLCRFGESESPHIYYFGDGKPRMIDDSGVRTVIFLNSGKSKSFITVKIDGFEELIPLGCADKCAVTMAEGRHHVTFATT